MNPTDGSVMTFPNGATTVGSIASYECIDGHILMGLTGNFRSCQNDGTWTESDPTCERT